jgi:hypothetical protein
MGLVKNCFPKSFFIFSWLIYGAAFGQSGGFLVSSVYQSTQNPCGSFDVVPK